MVKGVRFQNHEVIGDILDLASKYNLEGADELVFYDITASPDDRSVDTLKNTFDWVKEVQHRGAGEIVLNCMNHDGVKRGFDIDQLLRVRDLCTVPLIASGGAGTMKHFAEVIKKADVSGALAASVFHKELIGITQLKKYLIKQDIEVRI